jgi:hypothetical protein
MRIALLIEGETRISLGAKAVRWARRMLAALDYENVRNARRLSKSRDRLQLRVIRK